VKCSITPGTMGAAVLAYQIFGYYKVNPGHWPGPVYVDIAADEFEPGSQLLAEHNLNLNIISDEKI
jgi:hypothetical protein